MIDDPNGRIDYAEGGHGPTVVLVPGSCSTGAAWRPLLDRLFSDEFAGASRLAAARCPAHLRCGRQITTSLSQIKRWTWPENDHVSSEIELFRLAVAMVRNPRIRPSA